jgi:hypothetical protein
VGRFRFESDAHNKPLPTTIEEALATIPADFPPTLVVFTGNGLHAYWLFKEPWIFENDSERNEASALVSRFNTLLMYNSNQRGWTFERLSDLARVLRVPGTLNWKDPNAPKEVRIHSRNDQRYNPSEFQDYLEDLAIPDPEEQNRTAKEWKERFADKPITVNLDAEVPADMLNGWMEADMRFRHTWHCERHDLKDQSHSGYDLALACFGADKGLSEQQIVDLMVHHRRLHHTQARTREDYFQRTIAKAMKRAEGSAILASDESKPNGPPLRPAVVNDSTDPSAHVQQAIDNQRKARLCDQLSQLFGIRILRLLKISGKDPAYLMELEQGRIEIPDVGKLMSQQFIKLAFAARLGKVIPKFKPKQWEQLSQMLLDACIVEESSDELEFEGAARIRLERYLSENPPLTTLEGETVSSQSRPLIYDGKITVRASDLQFYINKTYLQNYSVIAVASMIKVIGGKAVRVRGSTFKDQDRWALPIADFDPKEHSNHYREDLGDGA